MADTAFSRISALDLSGLTEAERQAATVEVRAQLDAIAESGLHDVDTLSRKVVLLKMWQTLVRLRVRDVARNVPPPFEKPAAGRLYPELPAHEGEAQPEVAQESDEVVEEGDPNVVLVRTIKEGVVQGMRLPAGVTVETSLVDAESLVESGLGMIIQKSDVRPDEEVTRAVKKG